MFNLYYFNKVLIRFNLKIENKCKETTDRETVFV